MPYICNYHECNKECSGTAIHSSFTNEENDQTEWYITKVNYIQFEGAHKYSHLTLYSKLFNDGFFCLSCDCYYPLKYWLRDFCKDIIEPIDYFMWKCLRIKTIDK